MNKKILGAAIIALSAIGFTASAQDNTTPSPCPEQCENATACVQAPCRNNHNHCTPVERCAPGVKGAIHHRANCHFDKLNLTDEQKIKLKTVSSPRKMRRDAATNARKAYLDSIKEILTPDQYLKFLELNYTSSPKAFIDKKTNRRYNRQAFDQQKELQVSTSSVDLKKKTIRNKK